jgi:hypothetical protein
VKVTYGAAPITIHATTGRQSMRGLQQVKTRRNTKGREHMKRKLTVVGGTSVVVLTLLLTGLQAQSMGPAQAPLAQASSTSSVKGSGTVGQLPKWVGSSNPSVDVGDSIITETDSGHIGIGCEGSRIEADGRGDDRVNTGRIQVSRWHGADHRWHRGNAGQRGQEPETA